MFGAQLPSAPDLDCLGHVFKMSSVLLGALLLLNFAILSDAFFPPNFAIHIGALFPNFVALLLHNLATLLT